MCSSLQSEWPLYHCRNENDTGSGCKCRNALSIVQLTPSQAVSEFQSSHLSEIVCVCVCVCVCVQQTLTCQCVRDMYVMYIQPGLTPCH